MRRLLAGTLILAFLLPSPTTLAGGRGGPPRTILKVGGLQQKGVHGSYCWSHKGSTFCADYFESRWPRAKTTNADRNARIKICCGFEPRRSHLHVYRHVDEDGYPTGDGWRVPHEVRKRTKNGRTRYFLYFHITKKEGHYYLSLDTNLAKKNAGRGDVPYFFHLNLK